MAKPTKIKLEPVHVRGVCVDCLSRPQKTNGSGGFKPRCTKCDKRRFAVPTGNQQGKFIGTEMEERIRVLLLQGERTKRIALRLGICLRTVQNYRKAFGLSLRTIDFSALNLLADDVGSSIDYAPAAAGWADGQLVATTDAAHG